VSFFATAVIPDAVRARYYDNLISGLAMHVVGPLPLRLIFQAFVVAVGFLILAGAVNTSIVGANGVLNRVSEDGVLPAWFRRPHARFGTTYRLINLTAGLQVVTIVLSRGNVFLLGEACAFGVIWSFALKALAVLMLRYKQPDAPRPWRVPWNPRVGGTRGSDRPRADRAGPLRVRDREPVYEGGATIAGAAFTAAFFLVFVAAERIARGRRSGATELDQFQLETGKAIDPVALGARPGAALVSVRDYNTLRHLEWMLASQGADDRDIIAMTVRVLGSGQHGAPGLAPEQMFAEYEQRLFTRVVAIAERHGRRVTLLVVAGTNLFEAAAQAAAGVQAGSIVVGASAAISAERQAMLFGEAWDRLPQPPGYSAELVVIGPERVDRFTLGVHVPRLSGSDVERIHRLWFEAVQVAGPGIHHKDVVAAALDGLEDDLQGDRRPLAIARLKTRRV
jgi:hypothetical protein